MEREPCRRSGRDPGGFQPGFLLSLVKEEALSGSMADGPSRRIRACIGIDDAWLEGDGDDPGFLDGDDRREAGEAALAAQ